MTSRFRGGHVFLVVFPKESPKYSKTSNETSKNSLRVDFKDIEPLVIDNLVVKSKIKKAPKEDNFKSAGNLLVERNDSHIDANAENDETNHDAVLCKVAEKSDDE